MKNLKYYIAGIISVLIIVPVIDQLLEVIFLWIETLKIKPTKKILNGSKDMIILQDFIKQPEEVGDYEVGYLVEEDD